MLAIPQDGGDGGDDDPLAKLKADIGTARGKALVVETRRPDGAKAPQRRRGETASKPPGPAPPESLVAVADAAYSRVLAACGCSPALFDDSDGTSKREALRQWFMGTVKPLARLVEHELSDKLDTDVRLRFDTIRSTWPAGLKHSKNSWPVAWRLMRRWSRRVCWRETKHE